MTVYMLPIVWTCGRLISFQPFTTFQTQLRTPSVPNFVALAFPIPVRAFVSSVFPYLRTSVPLLLLRFSDIPLPYASLLRPMHNNPDLHFAPILQAAVSLPPITHTSVSICLHSSAFRQLGNVAGCTCYLRPPDQASLSSALRASLLYTHYFT